MPVTGSETPILGEVTLDAPEGEDPVVDLVSDDDADIIVENPKELGEVGESVPVTPGPPNIDEFVAEM